MTSAPTLALRRRTSDLRRMESSARRAGDFNLTWSVWLRMKACSVWAATGGSVSAVHASTRRYWLSGLSKPDSRMKRMSSVLMSSDFLRSIFVGGSAVGDATVFHLEKLVVVGRR